MCLNLKHGLKRPLVSQECPCQCLANSLSNVNTAHVLLVFLNLNPDEHNAFYTLSPLLHDFLGRMRNFLVMESPLCARHSERGLYVHELTKFSAQLGYVGHIAIEQRLTGIKELTHVM